MSFKFIADTNTQFTANNAEQVDDFALSGIMKNQAVVKTFQLGNTGDTDTVLYTVSIEGAESEITDNVELSDNNVDWAGSMQVSGIPPNGISDLLYMRYTPDFDDFTTSGTFLIDVDETVI